MKKNVATMTVLMLALTGGAVLGAMNWKSASAMAGGAAVQEATASVTLPNTAIYALNADNTLFVLRPGTTAFARLARVNKIDGNLIGIDFRPADGNGNALYGLTDRGSLYQISLTGPQPGTATLVSQINPRLSSGYQSMMDFNPVLNAVRLIGSNDQNIAVVNSNGNLNVAVAQTPLAYAQGDVNQGVDPNIAGGAYTNNYVGAPNTLFYGLDYDLDTLVTISSVNATGSSNTGGGQLQTIGKLVDANNNPLNLSSTADLDVYTDGAKANFLIGISGRKLFTIDLAQIPATLPLGQTQNIVARGITMTETGGGFVDVAVSPFGPAPTASPSPTATPAASPTPKPSPTPSASPTPAGGASLQAEAATVGGGSWVNTNHPGFTGAGFADFADGKAGGFVEFTVTQTGPRTLSFRYANGSNANRPTIVTVNGMTAGMLNFPPTGSWATWKTATLTVDLGAAAGNKLVRVTATTVAGGPNLDRLDIQ